MKLSTKSKVPFKVSIRFDHKIFMSKKCHFTTQLPKAIIGVRKIYLNIRQPLPISNLMVKSQDFEGIRKNNTGSFQLHD